MTFITMEVNIRDRLQAHWVRLIKDLFVDELVHHLFAKKVLTESMLEDVINKRSTRDKNYALLSVLQRKGPNAFPVFLEALLDTGQDALCDLLEPGYSSSKKGSDTDVNLNSLKGAAAVNLPAPISIPSSNASAFGNVVTQVEPSPTASPSVQMRPKPGSKPNSRPSSLHGNVFTSGQNSPIFLSSFFSGLDSPEIGISGSRGYLYASGSNGNLCADIAGSPESPIHNYPTIFDIDVKTIKQPVPQPIQDLARNWHGVYRNFSNPKGLCLIVNNRDFSKSATGLQYRDGSDRDASYLSYLFEKLGYKVIIEKDLDAESLENVVQEFSQNPEHQFADSAVVVILSHGQESGIYCCDGMVVKCKTLMDYMDGELCPLLIKKPKLFFIQACRGRVRQLGYEVPKSESDAGGRSRHGSGVSCSGDRRRSLTPERTLDAVSSFTRTASGGVGPRRLHVAGPLAPTIPRSVTDIDIDSLVLDDAVRDVDQPDPPACTWEFEPDPHGVDEEARTAPRKIPKYSDMLISYSTIPGYVSFRREDIGSWYVQAIVDVFSQHAHEKDINSLLTMVNRKVATCSATDLSFKQMPAPVNHLMKDFYFFPGLFETTEDEDKMEAMDVAPDTKGIDQHDSPIHGTGQAPGSGGPGKAPGSGGPGHASGSGGPGHAPGSGGCGQCGGKGRGRKNENSDFPRYSTL